MVIPSMSTHEIRVSAICVSDKYLIVFDSKSEGDQLFVYTQPLLEVHKAIVSSIQPFSQVKQMEIAQGYLLVLSSCFQAYTLPDLQLM